MLTFMLFPIFMFLSGLVVFCSKRNHLLLMLLSLEFIMLSIYFYIYIFLGFFNYEFYFSMVFLTMAVCEGALGLAILVSMVRTHGNDYFSAFNLLW